MSVEATKAKLLNYSRKHGKNHQFTLIRYFQERFLYRLSISKYKENFLLKGGALAYVLNEEATRPTKDIDFLLFQLKSETENLRQIFKEIAEIVHKDNVIFDTEDMSIEAIQKDGNYEGTRIKMASYLGNIKQTIKADIGVGDYVTSGPVKITYPTLLEASKNPLLLAYSIETFIAEKFHAMITLGAFNTRMKDFYDVYKIVNECDNDVLIEAIRNTFTRRETPYFENVLVFTKQFYNNENRLKQWNSFLNKNDLEQIEFYHVFEVILSKLKPIYDDMNTK